MFEGLLFLVAAILYSFAIWDAWIWRGLIVRDILAFGAGLTIDTLATVYVCIFRVQGSIWPNTFHGVMGYLALLIMATHFVWAWRAWRDIAYERRFRRFSPMAWVLWMVAFVSGIPW